MNGQHRVAHFFNGRDTPASDVIQVICTVFQHVQLFAISDFEHLITIGSLSLNETEH